MTLETIVLMCLSAYFLWKLEQQVDALRARLLDEGGDEWE